jgi:magnesium transporter
MCTGLNCCSPFCLQQVIPTQFVLFNLSAIVGSAILYQDFRRVTFHQFLTFLYGCAATFGGVYFLTAGPSGQRPDEEAATIVTARPERLAAIPEESGSSEGRLTAHPVKVLRHQKSATGMGLSPGQVRILICEIFALN